MNESQNKYQLFFRIILVLMIGVATLTEKSVMRAPHIQEVSADQSNQTEENDFSGDEHQAVIQLPSVIASQTGVSDIHFLKILHVKNAFQPEVKEIIIRNALPEVHFVTIITYYKRLYSYIKASNAP